MGVEDHGLGRQLVRFRWWPRGAPVGVVLAVLFAMLSAGAALDGAWAASAVLAAIPAALAFSAFRECAAAMGAVKQAQKSQR
jgi:hypothetical protein